MLPRRPKQIFLSRWSALWWAVCVIFFAVTTIGFASNDSKPAPDNQVQAQDAPGTDAMGQPISNEDAAVLKKLLDN